MLARERPDEQMKVIVQQAVAVELKRLPLFQFAERRQERLEVVLFVEDVLTVVSTVDDAANQTSVDGAERSLHSSNLSNRPTRVMETVLAVLALGLSRRTLSPFDVPL
jgi:hypothetical protein